VVAGTCAIGDTSIGVTLAGTVTTADQYADGYIHIQSSTGAGSVYKIKSNNAAASASVCTITLYPNDKLKVAVASGTATAGLRYNEYYGCVIRAASTAQVAPPVGVTPVGVTANYYFWIQTRGPAAVLQAATVAVIGAPVCGAPSVAGAVATHDASTTASDYFKTAIVGFALSVAASAEYGLTDLRL
jgi:hypothetical protein